MSMKILLAALGLLSVDCFAGEAFVTRARLGAFYNAVTARLHAKGPKNNMPPRAVILDPRSEIFARHNQ